MPIIDGFDDESIQTVGHLGIVAGAYDSLGIGKVIDRAIPKTRQHHLTHSQVVELMALNGLGFIERRLYLFPEFFDDIALERLIGTGTYWEDGDQPDEETDSTPDVEVDLFPVPEGEGVLGSCG
jgi:hypothetical protein